MKEPGITNDTDIVVSHDTENASELLQMDNKGCVLFNFWGTDLPGLVTSASEAKVKSLDQKRVLYQSDNSSFMVERLLPLFERFEGIETSYKDDTLDIAYKQLWGLMNDYLDRVESEDNNYMDVFASGKRWISEANACLDRAYRQYAESKDDRTKNAAVLFKSVMADYIFYGYIKHILQSKHSPYNDFLTTIPFNCWGYSFVEKANQAKKKAIHSQEDMYYISHYDNCRFFADFFNREYIELLPSLAEGDVNARDKMVDWICTLADDYIIRLTADHNVSPEGLEYAASLWIWEASYLINNRLFALGEIHDINSVPFRHEESRLSKEYKKLSDAYHFQKDSLQFAFKRIRNEFDTFIKNYNEGDDSQLIGRHVGETIAQQLIEKAERENSETVVEKWESPESTINGLVFTSALAKEKHQRLYNILKHAVDTKDYYVSFAYLKVAINKGYIRNPKFPELERAFDRYKGKERNYSTFMGKRGKFSEEKLSHEHGELLTKIEIEIENQLA